MTQGDSFFLPIERLEAVQLCDQICSARVFNIKKEEMIPCKVALLPPLKMNLESILWNHELYQVQFIRIPLKY